MQCEGKCQLNKEIKKTAEEESKKQSTIQNIQVEEIPSEKSFYTIPQLFFLNEVAYSFYSEEAYSSSLKHSTPPPKV